MTPDELREFLEPQFAKWWLPDGFEFVDEIPKTGVGKFRKTALREMFFAEPASRRTDRHHAANTPTFRSSSHAAWSSAVERGRLVVVS